MGVIYLIKNKINNKCYIGQTTRSHIKRWKEHCSKHSFSIINNAILKYKPENFELLILIEIENDKLDEFEVKYIKEYNSLYPNGYNIQTGGNLNKKHCEESKNKMRLSKLGEKNHNFGKPRSDETKEKIRISKLGEKHHFYGKELSLEHKLNLIKKIIFQCIWYFQNLDQNIIKMKVTQYVIIQMDQIKLLQVKNYLLMKNII